MIVEILKRKARMGLYSTLVAIGIFVWPSSYDEFSTEEYWRAHSVEDVADVPAEALERGNRKGPVLMWAASVVDDPAILRALVAAGADPDEKDEVFEGSALGAAATQNKSPEIIRELVCLGATVDKKLGRGHTALINAANSNASPLVVEELLRLGADPTIANDGGETALDIARRKNFKAVERVLSIHMAELFD